MKQHTIGLLAEYIIANRKGNAFKGDDIDSLVAGLEEDVKNNNLVYYVNQDGDFDGVLSFIVDRTNRIFFIRNILITRHAALVVFMRFFNLNYGGYTIAGIRKDGHSEYNTNRLLHLLTIRKGK